MHPELHADLSLASFLEQDRSILRRYQDQMLARFGPQMEGEIVEIGARRSDDHQRYFPRATHYRCTNVSGDFDEYLDVTRMSLPDASIDGLVCVSVLEHVFDIQSAAREMARVLRPGGKLLLVTPFAFPKHDAVDYWRLSGDAFPSLLQGFEIKNLVHLGGMISTIADNLKRPRRRYFSRYFLYKLLGAVTVAMLGRLERLDGLPLGFGVFAERER